MGCETGILKSVTSDCTTQPVGGIEVVCYAINRLDIATKDINTLKPNLIEGLTLSEGKLAYKIKGARKNLNCGFDRVVSDDMADTFKHIFSFYGFEFDSASVLNMDGLHDLVIIVENKVKSSNDGTYVAYGLKSGLYPTSDTKRANDSQGVRKIELASRDQENEPHSQWNLFKTDHETTKAMLEALCVVPTPAG